MPINDIITGSKPTTVIQPDQRFAVTFLSNKYRDYAVNGEVIMDKTSGELYIKDASNKVISFSQNKKYVYDFAMELRVLATCNSTFRYPIDTDTFVLSKNVDNTTLNNSKPIDILKTSAFASTDSTRVSFTPSVKTNGFFIRPMTRDCDKAYVEYLTNIYDKTFKTFNNPSDISGTAESAKMEREGWANSNAQLKIDIEVVNTGSVNKTYTVEYNVYLNETNYIELPLDTIHSDFPIRYTIKNVTIKELTFEKLQFMHTNGSEYVTDFDVYKGKFFPADERTELCTSNLTFYGDTLDDVFIGQQDSILVFMNAERLNTYMSKLVTMRESSEFILSPTKPSGSDWRLNTIWAENIRKIVPGGAVTNQPGAITFSELEMMIASTNLLEAEVTLDSTQKTKFYIANV